MARFPLRSTPSITSAAVELNLKFVVIRSMNRYHLYISASQAEGVRCADLGTGSSRPNSRTLHELLQEFAGAVVDELATFIEELVGMADIGFRAAARSARSETQRLPEMMIGAEAPIAPGVPLTTAPGLRSWTLLPYGLEPTSSAFLRTVGTDRLYSNQHAHIHRLIHGILSYDISARSESGSLHS